MTFDEMTSDSADRMRVLMQITPPDRWPSLMGYTRESWQAYSDRVFAEEAVRQLVPAAVEAAVEIALRRIEMVPRAYELTYTWSQDADGWRFDADWDDYAYIEAYTLDPDDSADRD